MAHILLCNLGLELAHVDQVSDLGGPKIVGLDGHLDLLGEEVVEPLLECLLSNIWK
jgi:hypothetical protein